jgi:hypothetical protein
MRFGANYYKFITALFLMLVSAAHSEVFNLSFEDCMPEPGPEDFNVPVGWNIENYGAVRNSFTPEDFYGDNEINWQISTLDPVHGNSFLLLSTNELSREPNFASAKQSITFEEGYILSGYYFFGTYDWYAPYAPEYNDYAYIKLVGSSMIELAYVDVNMVGDFNSTEGWRYFEHIFTGQEAGDYQLEFCVVDYSDFEYTSYLAVDNVMVCVPAEKGDIAGDCGIDLYDLEALWGHWYDVCGDPEWCDGADFDESAYVDVNDLSVIAENWLKP